LSWHNVGRNQTGAICGGVIDRMRPGIRSQQLKACADCPP
jgi:hypothetical protein